MPNRSRTILALALPIAVLVGACSSGGAAATAPAATAQPTTVAGSGDGYRYGSPSQAPASMAPSAAPASAPAAGDTTVALADTALGSILVDAQGRVLYGFKADAAGTSTCYDTCEQNWPPLLATGTPVAGTGIDGSKLSTIDRTDGTKQLKYGDWPLYYFAGDTAAGQSNGQGIGDVWYVLGADGAMIDKS
jgi:predicted lipoprotein with Yx(FWY)xxD motif